jgi:hypothetical protein
MSTIQFEGTAKTPRVAFHDSPLSMEISGRSIPENSIAFYTPLLDWVDEHLKAGGAVEVSIRLEYFNTSSSKCLMDLLKRVEQSAAEATVLWYYEEDDEDMLEAGEDYDAIIDMPFRLIATVG